MLFGTVTCASRGSSSGELWPIGRSLLRHAKIPNGGTMDDIAAEVRTELAAIKDAVLRYPQEVWTAYAAIGRVVS